MSDDPAPRPRHTLPRAFGCAFAGLFQLLRDERNVRIQTALALIAIGMGVWLQISLIEWALVVLCMAMVLAAEAMNTAIERAVDHTSLAVHPLAKQAKDFAAAAVLVVSAGSAAVGAIIFAPKLLALWSA